MGTHDPTSEAPDLPSNMPSSRESEASNAKKGPKDTSSAQAAMRAWVKESATLTQQAASAARLAEVPQAFQGCAAQPNPQMPINV